MLVFVSYSRADSKFVLNLVEMLRSDGVPIWIDQQNISTGLRWDRAIEEALQNATHFLLVMSKASIDSENVRDELDLALDTDKVIIPILIEDCTLPLRLRRIQYTDFRTNPQEALKSVLAILHNSKALLNEYGA